MENEENPVLSVFRGDPVRCRLTFKDTACGYIGQASWCDKSEDRCRDLANFKRFGGFPGMPVAPDEEALRRRLAEGLMDDVAALAVTWLETPDHERDPAESLQGVLDMLGVIEFAPSDEQSCPACRGEPVHHTCGKEPATVPEPEAAPTASQEPRPGTEAELAAETHVGRWSVIPSVVDLAGPLWKRAHALLEACEVEETCSLRTPLQWSSLVAISAHLALGEDDANLTSTKEAAALGNEPPLTPGPDPR